MRILYTGQRVDGHNLVTFRRLGQTLQMLPAYRHVRAYDCQGWEWCRRCPGALQLSLALLCHVLHDAHRAVLLHEEFCKRTVLELGYKDWALSDTEVVRAAFLLEGEQRQLAR